MDHIGTPILLRRHLLLATAFLTLLLSLNVLPASAQGSPTALTQDVWVKKQLSSSNSPLEFTFSVDGGSGAVTVGLLVATPEGRKPLRVELRASGEGGQQLCGTLDQPRNILDISCSLSAGEYTLSVSTSSRDALDTFVYYNPVPGISVGDRKRVDPRPGEIRVFKFNPRNTGSNITLTYDGPAMTTILLDKDNNVVSAIDRENPNTYALSDGRKPYYVIVRNVDTTGRTWLRLNTP